MTIEGTAADGAADTSNGVEQQRLPSKQRMELDAERIRSSIARLSSSSVEELEGLTSELRKLDEFLKTNQPHSTRNRSCIGRHKNYYRSY